MKVVFMSANQIADVWAKLKPSERKYDEKLPCPNLLLGDSTILLVNAIPIVIDPNYEVVSLVELFRDFIDKRKDNATS